MHCLRESHREKLWLLNIRSPQYGRLTGTGDKVRKTGTYIFVVLSIIILLLGYSVQNSDYSVLFILLVWCGLFICNIKKNTGNALTIPNTEALRGICAIEIVLGHIGLATGNIYLFPNRKAGILFVGIFFLISGYGLAYGFYNKKDYLKGFIKNRLVKIIFPLMIVTIYDIFLSKRISLGFIIENNGRWYVYELLLLYMIFYLVYRYCPKHQLVAVAVLSGILVLTGYLLNLGNHWYGSTMCFPLGIAYFHISSTSTKMKISQRILAALVATAVLGVSVYGFFRYENTFTGTVIGRSAASVAFCIVVILVLEKIDINSVITRALSKISYEIYLVHCLVISYVTCYEVRPSYLFAIVVIVASVVVAAILKLLENVLYRLIAKLKKGENYK